MAKAKIANTEGDYNQAIGLVLSVYQFEKHIGSTDLAICNLVGYSATTLANDAIVQILPDISGDSILLSTLKDQCSEISSKFPQMKTSVIVEQNMLSQAINERDTNYFIDMFSSFLSQEQIAEIKDGGEDFIEESMKYYAQHYSKYTAAFDLPYPEAYETLVKMEEQPKEESKNNVNAKIMSFVVPDGRKLLSAETKSKTYNNAIMTALNLYIANAQKGKLPDELPDGMPKDMFSGKDFKYEKTSDGFILRCQGKDLSKDETYEYKFNVKK